MRSAFARRVPTEIEGRELGVVSVGDPLLVCGPLELDYARKWAEQLGIAERLEAVLRESDRS